MQANVNGYGIARKIKKKKQKFCFFHQIWDPDIKNIPTKNFCINPIGPDLY